MKNEWLDQLKLYYQNDEYQKIIDITPMIPKVDWNYEMVGYLACALNNLSRYKEAEQLLLLVKAKGEQDPLWHFRLGYAYFYTGREEEAKEQFECSCRLAPEDKEAWRFLGWCCDILGKLPHLEEEKSGEEAENYQLEIYEQEDIEVLDQHIRKHYGEYEHVFHELVSPDIHVDICIVDPTPERNFYTLITLGMGAHHMKMPTALKGRQLDRAEILICLPPEWNIQSEEEQFHWPVRLLKVLARLPQQEDSWLGWGHTVSNEMPFAENTKLCGSVLLAPGPFAEDAQRCQLNNGDYVNFYQVIPLYQEEMDFKINYGIQDLLQWMTDDILSVVDICRNNVCDFRLQKQYYLGKEDIQMLLTDWEESEYCIASDRILVDGCKVGYMYREEARTDFLDSGWRFVAGDESEEYMEDMGHTGIYRLNIICNYDPDIVELLKAPCGTAFLRNEQGVFQKVELS